MIRPINLKSGNGGLLIDDDSVSSVLKTAAFYVQAKTQDLNDDEFTSWLELKRDNGFLRVDEIELEEDCLTDKFRIFMKDSDVLPPYILIIIEMLLDANGLTVEGGRKTRKQSVVDSSEDSVKFNDYRKWI